MTEGPELNERISRLETSVEAFHSELSDIRGAIRGISETLSRSRETNWSVIFAGVAVAGSLYAAAIRPLSADVTRIEHQSLKQTETIQKSLDYVIEHGSPITDKRLALIEYQLKQK